MEEFFSSFASRGFASISWAFLLFLHMLAFKWYCWTTAPRPPYKIYRLVYLL